MRVPDGLPSHVTLVHSPLVGPSVWAPLIGELERRGVQVTCPDLRGAVTADNSGRMQRFVDTAAAATSGDDVLLVGFSGAGAMLPNIAGQLGARVRTTVFIDAVVPPRCGQHRLSAEFAAFIDGQTTDGLLAPWLDWWPGEVAALLPDVELRQAIAADMPQVPRAFYDEQLELPAHWIDADQRYLQTSPAYGTDAALAASYGWPTAQLNGTHLSIATDPVGLLDALERLLV